MGSDAATSTVEPWEKCWDEESKTYYYFNSVTEKSTWDHPKVSLKKKPPKPKQEIREPDQWSKIDDGKGKGRKVWYNSVTGARQYELPDCRMKYKP